MGLGTKVIGVMVTYQVSEYLNGLMVANMRVTDKKTKCRVRDTTRGQMADPTRVNTKMIRRMA